MADSSANPKSLAQVMAAVARMEIEAVPRPEVAVAFARNITIEGIEPYLKYALLDSGLKPTITFGGYDLVRQDISQPDSAVSRARPSVVVLALALEHLDRKSVV